MAVTTAGLHNNAVCVCLGFRGPLPQEKPKTSACNFQVRHIISRYQQALRIRTRAATTWECVEVEEPFPDLGNGRSVRPKALHDLRSTIKRAHSKLLTAGKQAVRSTTHSVWMCAICMARCYRLVFNYMHLWNFGTSPDSTGKEDRNVWNKPRQT